MQPKTSRSSCSDTSSPYSVETTSHRREPSTSLDAELRWDCARRLVDDDTLDPPPGRRRARRAGTNTQFKLLKRQMYGRAGFALLRQRILLS
jgi:hypothetical protein